MNERKTVPSDARKQDAIQELREYRDELIDADPYQLPRHLAESLREKAAGMQADIDPWEVSRLVQERGPKRGLVPPERTTEYLTGRLRNLRDSAYEEADILRTLRMNADENCEEPVADERIRAFMATTKKQGTGRLKRTLLSDAMRDGVPDPEELEPDVLIKGAAHQIFTGPEQGKTWVALWLIKNAIERGESAAFFDMENGQRIITERLQALGVGDDVDDRLHYFYLPSLDMNQEARTEYEALLDEAEPELVVFDSWIGFLARCGFDENSPTQVEQWANAYVQSAKSRGCTVVILDHVPHDANRSRGATRKKDLVDVQWNLKKIEHFDRDTVGYVQLTREKDREAWLPQRVGFSIGGTREGFICRRSTGTVQDHGDGLTKAARVALAALEAFKDEGATYVDWRKATNWKEGEPMPETTFRRARNLLIDPVVNKVRQDGNRYYSHNSQTTATAVTAVGHNTTATTATPPCNGVAAVAVGDAIGELVDVEGLSSEHIEYLTYLNHGSDCTCGVCEHQRDIARRSLVNLEGTDEALDGIDELGVSPN